MTSNACVSSPKSWKYKKKTILLLYSTIKIHYRMNANVYINRKRLTLMTTTEQPQTLRGFPSLSILQRPDHSPNFLFESTRINGIWCSLHKAVINFLYCGSSQDSAKIARTAWRLKIRWHLLEKCQQNINSDTDSNLTNCVFYSTIV